MTILLGFILAAGAAAVVVCVFAWNPGWAEADGSAEGWGLPVTESLCHGTYTEFGSGAPVTIENDTSHDVQPWGYRVLIATGADEATEISPNPEVTVS